MTTNTTTSGSDTQATRKDCLACRMIGTAAFFGLSVYLFRHGFKEKNFKNKLFTHSIGTGIRSLKFS